VGPGQTPLNREGWLRAIFSENIRFTHFKKEFHFVPELPLPEVDDDARFIVGKIGRRYSALENEPPEEGLAEILHEAWLAAAVIIDPTSHDDGQKVAFEAVSKIGTPLPIFESLAKHINSQTPKEPFVLEVNPIVDPETFWQFEAENRGAITFVEFDLLVPNMFGIRHDLDEELKALRDAEKVRKAKLGLENEDGLNLDTERTRQTVSYTLEGGGAIKARTRAPRKTFNSKKKGKRIKVDPPAPPASVTPADALVPVVSAPETFASKVSRAISKVFGA
jgi:hypothetical protein